MTDTQHQLEGLGLRLGKFSGFHSKISTVEAEEEHEI